MPKPFVKWAGGKTKLLPHLLPLFPEKFRRYYEPMVGGGAVFFALEGRFESALLADTNRDLMDAYKALRDKPDDVIRALGRLVRKYPPTDTEAYYEVRGRSPRTMVTRAARLLYLNKTCFNGLYRVNSHGYFNVPFGRYKSPNVCDEGLLRSAHAVLERATLLCGDALQLGWGSPPPARDDWVYFDPPYAPTSSTASFSAYSPGGFTAGDQRRLATLFFDLSKATNVILTNSDTPLVRDLYRGATLTEVSAPRAINSKADRRGLAPELIITP